MNVVDRPGRPPLSPQEGWISDGRQVLHFKPLRYDRWSQSLELTLGEVMPAGEPPLLKVRHRPQPQEPARQLEHLGPGLPNPRRHVAAGPRSGSG